jgi:prevent-host-death family protein
MKVATSRSEVGIRDLNYGLSKYIDRVQTGEEVIVTDRGRPVAKLSPLDASDDRLADIVATGVVRPPSSRTRHRSRSRLKPKGNVSGLVSEQRR